MKWDNTSKEEEGEVNTPVKGKRWEEEAEKWKKKARKEAELNEKTRNS